MILSEERRAHLAHVVVDGIWKDDLVDYSDEDMAMRTGKQAAEKFVSELEQIDAKARQMVNSLKRNVMEGTPEWDVLYKKYFEEEMSKRG